MFIAIRSDLKGLKHVTLTELLKRRKEIVNTIGLFYKGVLKFRSITDEYDHLKIKREELHEEFIEVEIKIMNKDYVECPYCGHSENIEHRSGNEFHCYKCSSKLTVKDLED